MLNTEFVEADDSASKRLMVVLHGLGDSMAGYRWLPTALQLPWMNYVLVDAPDPYFGGFSWYDFSGDADAGIQRSQGLLFELIDHLQDRGFSASEMTLFGFSQGCLMIWEMGVRYPRLFAGLVGISGYVHNPELLRREMSPVAKRQRFLVTHGTIDPMIPFAEVREQINLLKGAGLNIEWHEFIKPHTIAGEEELDVIRRFVIAGSQDR
jgi:phospholipase/carboxylesterase